MDQVPKTVCKECLNMETVFVYFVNHKERLVIEEWVYCKTCFPTSDCCLFNRICYESGVEETPSEEAHRLIEQEGYRKHVP